MVVVSSAGLQDVDVLVGNDVGNIDLARWQIKSPFERNVVTQFDIQVHSTLHYTRFRVT